MLPSPTSSLSRARPDPLEGWPPVHRACLQRDGQRVRALLEQDPTRLMSTTPQGFTPMMVVAMGGDSGQELIGWARERWPERLGWLHVHDQEGRTLLHHAVLNQNLMVLDDLVKEPYPVHEEDVQGNTPLHLAARKGWLEGVRRLTRAGASPGLLNRQGETPEMLALEMGHGVCAQALRENAPQVDPDTWLFDAVCSLSSEEEAVTAQVERALSLGASPNKCGEADEEVSALHHAVHNGHWGAAKVLVEHGASVNALDDQGNEPLVLMVSSLLNHPERLNIAEWLIDQGANVAKFNDHGVNAAMMARLVAEQRPSPERIAFAQRCTRLENALHRAALEAVLPVMPVEALAHASTHRARRPRL